MNGLCIIHSWIGCCRKHIETSIIVTNTPKNMDCSFRALDTRSPQQQATDADYEAVHMRLKQLFVSEFFGTFLFVYLGQSSASSFELVGTQNDIVNRQLATIVFYGLAYLIASLLALQTSGAHLNPAYSISSAVFGFISWSQAFIYIIAQYLGSFIAAVFLHATLSDKLNTRHSEGLLVGMNATLRAHGNILSTGKLFSSFPPTEVSTTQLCISYALATASLTLLLILIHQSRIIKIPRFMKPIYLASALALVLGAFSANGGPVLNPAQDFSPRLYIAFFGWGSSAFNLYNFKYWWLCGLLAPHFGSLIGMGIYKALADVHECGSRKSPI